LYKDLVEDTLNPKKIHKISSNVGFMINLSEMISEGKMVKRWILITMFSAFAWQVMFYVPLYAAEFIGVDPFIIGGMSTASTIVFVFLAIPLGYLADTRGRKKRVIAATLLFCTHIFTKSYFPTIIRIS